MEHLGMKALDHRSIQNQESFLFLQAGYRIQGFNIQGLVSFTIQHSVSVN